MPYRCKDFREHFSVKQDSVFQSSKLGYSKLLLAVHLLTSHNMGISLVQFAKLLGCTQKSAWHLEHRIRTAMEQNHNPVTCEVEADETYMGGRAKNMHARERERRIASRGGVDKAAVFGMKERGSEVRAEQVSEVTKAEVQSRIAEQVERSSVLLTEEAAVERGPPYEHHAVAHSVGEYVRGMAHTNGVNSFWALLMRGFIGTYHMMSPKHLGRYIDEFATRYNYRKMPAEQRVNLCLIGAQGKTMPYKELMP